MGLGGATKKLQKVADMGDELYGKINELREQVVEMRVTVQDTHRRVEALENKVDQQGAVLEALAEEQGIDVDAVLTEVAIEEAEPAITEVEEGEATAEGDGSAGGTGDADATGDADDAIGDAEEDR
jgi:uncharacterized coiled-coil DUF342 family protein